MGTFPGDNNRHHSAVRMNAEDAASSRCLAEIINFSSKARGVSITASMCSASLNDARVIFLPWKRNAMEC